MIICAAAASWSSATWSPDRVKRAGEPCGVLLHRAVFSRDEPFELYAVFPSTVKRSRSAVNRDSAAMMGQQVRQEVLFVLKVKPGKRVREGRALRRVKVRPAPAGTGGTA